MGQYYHALLINHNEAVCLRPFDFNNGMKLMEFSWIGNDFVNAVLSKIWKNPQQVACIGDYSDDAYNPDTEAYARAISQEDFSHYYKLAWSEKHHAPFITRLSLNSSNVVNYLTKRLKDGFFINHSKKIYLRLKWYIRRNTKKGWCINPLPLLTACGNGQGGGDFHEGNTGYENAGVWAFDIIEYTDTPPSDEYKEVRLQFVEDAVYPSTDPDKALFGLKFVIAGRIKGHSHEDIAQLIWHHNGRVSPILKASTSYLIAGEGLSKSQMATAARWRTKKVSYEELLNMIEQRQ